ncbi:MAG: hypothetical protein OXC07_08450 [Kistimonas sp.]|nr:hypothetical protein [Kistimonas sp.]
MRHSHQVQAALADSHSRLPETWEPPREDTRNHAPVDKRASRAAQPQEAPTVRHSHQVQAALADNHSPFPEASPSDRSIRSG